MLDLYTIAHRSQPWWLGPDGCPTPTKAEAQRFTRLGGAVRARARLDSFADAWRIEDEQGRDVTPTTEVGTPTEERT